MRNPFHRQKPATNGMLADYFASALDDPCACPDGVCSGITVYLYADRISEHDFEECARCEDEIKYEDAGSCPNNPGITFYYLNEHLRARSREATKERAAQDLAQRQTRWTVISGVVGALALVLAVVALMVG